MLQLQEILSSAHRWRYKTDKFYVCEKGDLRGPHTLLIEAHMTKISCKCISSRLTVAHFNHSSKGHSGTHTTFPSRRYNTDFTCLLFHFFHYVIFHCDVST